jgi:di/tripeptidase
MLEATRRVLAENRPHAGIELLFTPKEEVGLLGAAAFDHTRLQAQLGYVYDQAAPIGEIVLGAPYSQAMKVRFHGRASHSGMYPEEGRSAIAAAALERSGHPPVYVLSGGAADANVFNELGLPCVNLANGMTAIHTPDEHIAVGDLDAMVEVTLALVEEALA